ncbi:YdeI/OmpD-associated family protein [Actinopolymorpha pittospori]|uniref:DUF1905 domain-containing protein n=1 Tax=Actinopolymorpha pittospori TaxID=648752 RepID=A0A927MVN0_9ACTN|nr:YdeI/OmpD-associated family protein [Actinopolymorpha pittospori]MBE1607449.1 hypothetical protein [Actinopolymorpha pittospori]
MKFHAVLESHGKSATGIVVPADVVEALGSGKRPRVRVTINGHTYRSTVAVMSGAFMIGVSAENRAGAGIAAGDEIEVELALDSEPREVTVPPDFAVALEGDAQAKEFFGGLSYSQQRWFVEGIESAKKPETRQRRVEAAVERLRSGRGQR